MKFSKFSLSKNHFHKTKVRSVLNIYTAKSLWHNNNYCWITLYTCYKCDASRLYTTTCYYAFIHTWDIYYYTWNEYRILILEIHLVKPTVSGKIYIFFIRYTHTLYYNIWHNTWNIYFFLVKSNYILTNFRCYFVVRSAVSRVKRGLNSNRNIMNLGLVCIIIRIDGGFVTSPVDSVRFW